MGRVLVNSGDADTELSLRTGGSSVRSCLRPASPQASSSPSSSAPSGRQLLTIFYGDRICVCDVTQVQARAIIAAAHWGTAAADHAAASQQPHEEITREQQPGGGLVRLPVPMGVEQQHPTQRLSSGLSMKTSLQRFLQKRKTRSVLGNTSASASAPPYARPHDHLRPPYRRLHQQQQPQRQASLFL